MNLCKKIDEKFQTNPASDMENLGDMIVKSVTKAIQPLEQKINEIVDTIDNNTRRIDTLESKIEYISKNPTTNIQTETLNKEINGLKAQLIENNLVISGIKEIKNENVFTIVQNIGAKLNTKIDPTNVRRIVRMQKAGQIDEHANPSILVEFVHEPVKNRLIWKTICQLYVINNT